MPPREVGDASSSIVPLIEGAADSFLGRKAGPGDPSMDIWPFGPQHLIRSQPSHARPLSGSHVTGERQPLSLQLSISHTDGPRAVGEDVQVRDWIADGGRVEDRAAGVAHLGMGKSHPRGQQSSGAAVSTAKGACGREVVEDKREKDKFSCDLLPSVLCFFRLQNMPQSFSSSLSLGKHVPKSKPPYRSFLTQNLLLSLPSLPKRQ